MQWLIDLVIEAIGIPPCFIDRGDPAAHDFVLGDLTADGAWHDMDLSAIIPAGATGVTLFVSLAATVVNNLLQFRTKGNVNDINLSFTNTQVANVALSNDLIVPLDANRVIQYNLTPGNWIFLFLSVKGWWL